MLSASKSGRASAGGYTLSKSLRFRSSASAYLNRTIASSGNRLTWTWSAWVKRGGLTASGTVGLFGLISSDLVNQEYIAFNGNQLVYFLRYLNTDQSSLFTTQVFRDPSACYHIVVVVDNTQATASNRLKMYVNGVQITSFSTSTYSPQNQNTLVTGSGFTVGTAGLPPYLGTPYFDGYLAEVNFIDGQALTPSSFGSFSSTTGVWQPIKYSGTYGTNGFYLPFTNTTSTTTLGYDSSGNGNNWTTNNISLTAGTTYDSMTDVPTLTSATVANYPVLNVLQPNPNGTPTYSNGNLFVNCANASSFSCVPATMLIPTTGKWYAEFYLTNGSTTADVGILGINDFPPTSYVIGAGANSYAYRNTGNKLNNSNNVSYGASYATGDTIGVALDMGAGTLTFYKNNTSQGVAFTGLTSQYYFAVDGYNYTQWSCNFGQQPFTYTPPSGFVALNAYNLPTPTILAGNKYMDATLYSGNLIGQTITNAGAFKPDLVWVKSRSAATDNKLTDSVRGATLALVSNSTAAETTDATGVVSFNSNGFTLGTSTTYNNTGATYVGWQWQAGQGSTSSNTNGSITSTVSVNASAGFSVVTYTGTGANATVGHGLGVAPQFIFVKYRNGVIDWRAYHSSIGNTNFLVPNTSVASAASSATWNNTSPTSSVFSIGTALNVNNASANYVAYCWAAISGFSAFGSYTGNGSASGPFIYCGFQPKYILFKRTDSAESWLIKDTARNPYNSVSSDLYVDLANAEDSSWTINVTANGFQLTSTGSMNASGGTYIYAAFASNPFRNSLAF